MIQRFVFFVIGISFLISCQYLQPKEESRKLARVGENYLYEKDLVNLGLSDIPPDDSVKLVNNYIDNWIRKQSLLQNARENLTNEQLLELDTKVSDYRESLLSFLYESQILEQKLDTVVARTEIVEYYEQHQEDFAIVEPIIKFFSIKNNKEFNDIRQINSWLTEYLEEGNDSELKEYCSFEAITCFFEMDDWVKFTYFYETLGTTESSTSEIPLTLNRLFKYEDDSYFYLYKILEIQREGVYPLKFVEEQIESLIVRKREQEFLENLRNSIYETAKRNNEIEIYE